jgi:hypothetical protein
MREVKMGKSIVILAVIAAAVSCSDSERNNFIVTEPMYTSSVEMPDTISFGQQIRYTAHASLLNGCERYSHHVQSVDEGEIYVTLYKNWDIRDDICTDEVTPIEVNGAYHPNEAGTYIFNFWRPEDEFLRREVVVR